jgi:hypothetical protein
MTSRPCRPIWSASSLRSCASSRSQLTLSSAIAMLEDIHRDVVRLIEIVHIRDHANAVR